MEPSSKKQQPKSEKKGDPEDDDIQFMEGEVTDKRKIIENIHLDDREKEKYAYLMFSETKEKKDRYKVSKEL